MPRKVNIILVFALLISLVSACRPTLPATSTPVPVSPTFAPPSPTTVVTTSPVYLKISEIQGTQHRSPFDGQSVANILGVVTALKGNDFYMQDPEPDDDPRTSEGIFVVRRSYARLKPGDLVLIEEAKVREVNPAGVGANSLTITTLEASKISLLTEGHGLPTPTLLGTDGVPIPNQVIENDVKGYMGRDPALFDPAEDGIDFFESLESMRVEVRDALAVSSTNAYKEVAVVADRGADACIFAETGALVLRPDDPNPERIILDDSFINMPQVWVGSRFNQPIVGIIEYSFSNFKLSPTQKIIFQPAPPPAVPAPPARQTGSLSVASFNVENLSPERYPAEHRAIARQIVEDLGSPDLLALQEILDDDGVMDSGEVSALENIGLLITEIRSAGGPLYRAMQVEPLDNREGGVRGGNIRSIILYRSDSGLAPMSAPHGDASTDPVPTGQGDNLRLSLNPGRIGNRISFFNGSRKPLVAGFTYQGKPLVLISIHLKSKSEDGPLFGDQQPPVQSTVRQRLGQAEVIADFARTLLEASPDLNLGLAGDFNDFPWAESLEPLTKAGLVNLADTLEENERYSHNHEGNAQMLDQLWVSQSMAEKLTWFQPIHINSLTIAPEQVSDHDPVLAQFDFSSP